MCKESHFIKSLCHPPRSPERYKRSEKAVDESKNRERYPRTMKRASNIDTKDLLDNSQYNRPHDDNGDIGKYEEENASNHRIISSRDYTEVTKVASR